MEHAIWLLYFSVKQFCYPKISLWHRPLDYFIRFYDEVERVQWLQSTSEHMVFFKNGLFPASFSFLFSSFQYNTIHLTVNNNCSTKICRCLDSNRGPLVSEATALPTEPQPLPKFEKCLSRCFGWKVCIVFLRRVEELQEPFIWQTQSKANHNS